MNVRMLVLLAASAIVSGASATDWSLTYRPATVKYTIYAGGLGDPVAPSKTDGKVAFAVMGSAAKAVFESIGPDKPDQCSSGSSLRYRSKDDDRLSCTRSSGGQYSCYFGFDLKSGKSVGGSIC